MVKVKFNVSVSHYYFNVVIHIQATQYSDAARGWAEWALAHPEFGSANNQGALPQSQFRRF